LRDVEKRTGLSYPTVRRAVEVLQGAGILVEITAKKRDRVYSYPKYLAILNAGTEQV
jgi:Fe2+ or Zn2+ uptake regulation protein